MHVLVTGHGGYLGSVLVPLLRHAGHRVTGVDAFVPPEAKQPGGSEAAGPDAVVAGDIRDLTSRDLAGVDTVVHLAEISDGRLCGLVPDAVADINHAGAVHVARAARDAGVRRFVLTSTCAVYGPRGGEVVDESAEVRPTTPYARSKASAEVEVLSLAGDGFDPVVLRSGDTYGLSPRTRADLAVNEMVAEAATTGRLTLAGDGTAWRPFLHVRDLARSVVAVVEARPDELRHRTYNVGVTTENYQLRELAVIVAATIAGTEVDLPAGVPDPTPSLRLDCDRWARDLPEAAPFWTVRRGVDELVDALPRQGSTGRDLGGDRSSPARRIERLVVRGHLDGALRWVTAGDPAGVRSGDADD